MANILIVEDEADIAELYRLFLEGAGHRILGVYADPIEALAQQGRMRELDLVILDERLGVRSGSSFLRSFREIFRGSKLLLVSADPDAVGCAESLGFDEAKRKPVTLKHLIENIESLLSRPPGAG
ncbi:MAG: response regulator [Planctomycetaceae bacterium]|nr:response regulator [Planctomycetaceae bacterium]